MSIIFENQLCGKTLLELDMTTRFFYIIGSIADCIVIVFALYVLFYPSLQRIYITAGLIVNFLLNLLIKEIVHVPRPEGKQSFVDISQQRFSATLAVFCHYFT